MWKCWCSYSRICGTVAFHGIFSVGPSGVSDLRYFHFYNVSVSPFQGFGGNFNLSAFCLWYTFNCTAKNSMRSSPVTVLTTYVMSERSTISTFTSGLPKTCSVFGVLSLLLHPSTIFVHWSHCLFCLYLKVHCRQVGQKQLLLWLLCSAWNISWDFYRGHYINC